MASCTPKTILDVLLCVPGDFSLRDTQVFWVGRMVGVKFDVEQSYQKNPDGSWGSPQKKEAGAGGFLKAFLLWWKGEKKKVLLSTSAPLTLRPQLSAGRETPPKSFTSYLDFLKAPKSFIMDLKNPPPVLPLFSNSL